METPENSPIKAKIKLRNEQEVMYIPYEKIQHVMRLIAIP